MGSVSALRGRTVLIVEDEPLIAFDICEEMAANGAHAVTASTVEQALEALSRLKFAVAIVDHRLGSHDATAVVRRLKTLQIPFVIHSGHAEASLLNVPMVHKPAAHQELMQAVSDLLG